MYVISCNKAKDHHTIYCLRQQIDLHKILHRIAFISEIPLELQQKYAFIYQFLWASTYAYATTNLDFLTHLKKSCYFPQEIQSFKFGDKEPQSCQEQRKSDSVRQYNGYKWDGNIFSLRFIVFSCRQVQKQVVQCLQVLKYSESMLGLIDTV